MKTYLYILSAFVGGVVLGAAGLSKFRIAAINPRSELSKTVFRKPLSRMIVEEFPTLRLSVAAHEIKWSLMFMGKEIARNQEDSLKEIARYSGWAKEFDQDWSVIIVPSTDLTVADLRSVVAVLYRNGFGRIWITELVYGNATPN